MDKDSEIFMVLSSENCLYFIIISALVALAWVIYAQKTDRLQSNKNIIQLLPSIISTLGVLGTFWGITMGLLQFDPEHIDTSIPELLEGLKTAFFTSLAGMIGSMVLSGVVNKFYDKEESDKPSSTDEALIKLYDAIKSMDANLKSQSSSQSAFYNTLLEKLDGVPNIPDDLQKMLLHQQSVDASVVSIKNSVEQVNKSLDDSHDSLDGIAGINQEQLEETKKFSQVLPFLKGSSTNLPSC